MHLSRRHLPSPALAVASLALLLALSGTAGALPGKKKIDSNDFAKGVVSSKAIKDKGVAGKDIRNGAITSAKLAPGAVTSNALAPGAVRSFALADGAVTGSKLTNGSITAPRLGGSSVTGAAIAANAVTDDELAPNSVSADEIVSNGVGGGEIASNAVEGEEIANGSVGPGDVANGAITSAKLGGLTVRTSTAVNVPGGLVAEDAKYETDDATASCNAGEVAVGGGLVWSADNDDEELVTVNQQFVIGANGRPTGIKARGGNDLGPGQDRTLTVQALCLAP